MRYVTLTCLYVFLCTKPGMFQGSPLTLEDGKFVVKGLPEPTASEAPIRTVPPKQAPRQYSRQPIPKPAPLPLPPRIPHEPRPVETDDDNMTDITRTEDDPVEQAFRTVLGASAEVDEEDDEDEIVWNPGLVFPSYIGALYSMVSQC